MRRVISASLSPNAESEDVALAIRTLFSPWQWQSGEAVEAIEKWFGHYFSTKTVATFDSGRAALLALLKAFNIGSGDEVLIQAFTCVAVPNSVIWAGARPVYVDIDQALNLDPSDAEKKITPQTKAVVVQHTFGVPAQMEKIMALAKKYKLILIEDCAHSLGGTYRGQKLGTFGQAAFFSFGRDKAVSSVWGGAAVISSKFPSTKLRVQSSKLKKYQEELSYPSLFWIFQQLLHPIAFLLILPTYNLGLGKVMLWLLQHLKLLSVPVYPEEKSGRKPTVFPAKYPHALAVLLLNQLKKLDRYLVRRQETARYYQTVLKSRSGIKLLPQVKTGYLRYPVLVAEPERIIKRLKRSGVLLGNWYHHVVDPAGVNLAKVGYRPGSCPRAEAVARKILNLPTLISRQDAERVVKLL